MSGMIYVHFKKLPIQEMLDFAAAAAVNKLTEAGDATSSTVADIQTFSTTHER